MRNSFPTIAVKYIWSIEEMSSGWNSGSEAAERKENVEFILSATVKELVGESMVEKLILNDKKTGKDFELHVSGVFVAVGRSLKTRRLQIR